MTMRKSAATTNQIKAANKALGKAAAAGDAAAIADLYSKNAILMPPGTSAKKTRGSIKSWWAATLKSGVAGVTLRTIEVEVSGNTANEIGAFRLSDARKKTVGTGNYVVIWKKEGKQWKLHRDIFNSNQ